MYYLSIISISFILFLFISSANSSNILIGVKFEILDVTKVCFLKRVCLDVCCTFTENKLGQQCNKNTVFLM